MSANPCYASWAMSQYLAIQREAEIDAERLDAQIATELRNRETWEMGMAEAAIETVGSPNPILDALMAEDFAEAGRLVHRYITDRYAREAAEIAIHRQDEDAANDFSIG